MSDPGSDHHALEDYSYTPLERWLATGRPVTALDTAIYMTSHFWTTAHSTAATLSVNDVEDLNLAELETFLNRDRGTWFDVLPERKARWLEIYDPVSSGGRGSPFTEALCRHLRLPRAVFASLAPPGRDQKSGVKIPRSRIVEYGHVTHVRLDGGDGALHVFTTNYNSVITVSEFKSLAHTTLVSQGLRANPAPSDDWDEGNAATVLWSVIKAVAKSFIQESLKPPSMDCSLDVREDILYERTRMYNARISQLAEICGSLLDREGEPGEVRKWLTAEVQAQLENASFWCTEDLRRTAENREREKLFETRWANNLAAEQAHSAVILNLLLFMITGFTICCQPFILTAGYFGMNVFGESSQNTVGKFWIVAGSITCGLVVIGVAMIAFMAKYGAKVHKIATTLFGARQKIEDQFGRRQPAGTFSDVIDGALGNGDGVITAEAREKSWRAEVAVGGGILPEARLGWGNSEVTQSEQRRWGR